MKKLVTLLLLLFSSISFSQNDSGQAYYSKKSVHSFDETALSPDVKKVVNQINENLPKLVYLLKFNNTNTLFSEVEKMDTSKNGGLEIKVARIASGTSGMIYYDSKTNLILHQFNFAGQEFLVTKKTKTDEWKLTKESIKINNYTCYKAIKKELIEAKSGNRIIDVVAWYTPEISLNYGPDGYLGLPGLIVQLERNNIVTYLTKITFEDNVIIEKPTEGKKVTEEEFDKIVKDVVSNREAIYSDN